MVRAHDRSQTARLAGLFIHVAIVAALCFRAEVAALCQDGVSMVTGRGGGKGKGYRRVPDAPRDDLGEQDRSGGGKTKGKSKREKSERKSRKEGKSGKGKGSKEGRAGAEAPAAADAAEPAPSPPPKT